jgi:hypothetical protein
MESKKINQLATELSPVLSDLTIIGDPTTGISKKITLSQMASLFTGTVEEYPNLASFPLVGTADTIYIALDTNIIYRWNTGTSAYVELSPNIVTSLVFSDANGFDGTISLVGSTATLTITTALTQGSVPFIGTSGALTQDNANLFFDDTNNRLGINTNSPTTALDVFGSGIIGRINGTTTNNAFLGFASAGTNKWSIGNVQFDHRFRIYNEATTSELLSLLETGEFGIGIANPTTKVHIDGGASALIANLDANVSVAKSISFRSDNSNRINLEVSGTESGSNAGADLFIRRYSDAGALLDTPLFIKRSTGNIGIATTSPNIGGYGTNSRVLTIQGVSGSYGILELTSNSANADGSAIGRLDFGSDGQDPNYKAISSIASFLSGSTSTRYGADLRFYTRADNAVSGDPVERLRITSTGLVGINTINPSGEFHVKAISGFAELYLQGAGSTSGMYLFDNNTESGLWKIDSGYMAFATTNIERLRITSDGKLKLTSTSGGGTNLDMYLVENDGLYINSNEGATNRAIYFQSGGTTKGIFTSDNYLRLSNSGIQFNGDTSSANALNDYEEGLSGTTVTCSSSGTITLNTGYDSLSYVKIGSIVHVSGLLSVSSVSSPTGSIRISLPFQCANLGDSAGTATGSVVVNGTVSAVITDFVSWVDELTSYIVVYSATSTSVTAASAQQVKANTDIYIQITYRTA